jgi:hypothetical protein
MLVETIISGLRPCPGLSNIQPIAGGDTELHSVVAEKYTQIKSFLE